MSWEYTYYAAYRDKKEDKLYFLGPYNFEGCIKDVISRSRSFASDLHEYFDRKNCVIKKEQYSKRLLKDLQNIWGISDEEMERREDYSWSLISYCSLDELPKGDYIKSGYFLNEEITEYEKEHNWDSLSNPINAEEYARMLQNEIRFGKPGEKINEWGEKYIPHSCEDYSFYCYPDYSCEEYEMSKIREMIDILTSDGYDFLLKNKDKDNYYKVDPDYEMGVILIQG